MAHRNNFHKQYNQRQVKLRVLLDMDQVLCDFEGGFLNQFKKQYPEEPCVELEDREGFWLRDQYDKIKPGLAVKCANVYNAKGFFAGLKALPGALEAAKEIGEMEDVDAFICTSPVTYYKYCLREKFNWVEKHLGKQWVDRIILTKDKTMAYGHILIDDKPNITGANPYPSWDHVLFLACHNKQVDPNGRMVLHNWTDGKWREMLEECKKKI